MTNNQPSNACRKSVPSSSKHIKHLFRHTVSSSDRHDVQQYLLDSEAELCRYQAEVNRLKAKITVVETRMGGLKRKIRKYRTLLSPVYRLPSEIWAEVFLFFCEGESLIPLKTPAVMVVSRVCGRWRDIALSTPRIWSTISLRFEGWTKGNGGRLDRLQSLLVSFLQRSKNMPLTVNLNSLRVEKQDEIDGVVKTLEGLLNHSTRWQHLDCTHSLLALPAFQSLRNRLPELKSLYVESGMRDNSSSLFHDCPSLTSISISPDSWSDSDFPLHQMKTLSLRRSYAPAALAVLRSCTNAYQLEMHSIGGMSRPDTDHIILPKIRQLTITAENEEDAMTVFQFSTLQSLTSLEIRRSSVNSVDWNRWDLGPVKDFFLRSSCALTSLKIGSVPLSDEETIQLLLLMPTLTNLSIEEYPKHGKNKIVTDAFLQLLSSDEDELASSFLPSLNHLDLIVHLSSLHIPSLIHAIASRAPDDMGNISESSCGLRSVTLTVMAKEKPDMSPFFELQCFGDAGLRMNIFHKTIC
ncbi:hypothetical protein AAF712_001692 [Marasmius tenuissimus]|uniref:F-box domain-containing protein n=1 Tax=Marasmius tenuissimus TaxID=585030 RepID=A0ABR3ACS4_9AGAR